MGTQPIDLPPGRMTLVELLRLRAQRQPDHPIYSFQSQHAAEARLHIGELDRQARAIGAQLQQLGLDGQRALLLYPPGLDYIAAFFGCLYANIVAVPAYLPPSNRPAPRLQAIVADARPVIALTTSATRANLQPQIDSTPQLAALRWLTTDVLPTAIEQSWQPPDVSSATLAFLQYTSGSTATPKGVMLSHGNLLHNSAQIASAFGHSAASRGVIWLPPYHDMGLIGGIIQPLYAGFPVTLMSPVAFLQRPLRWLETIAQTRATTSGGPNFAYDLCVRKSTPEQRAALDLSSWTVAFSGAEPVRAATIERFVEAFGPAGFRRTAFYPCYGLAETTLLVSGGEVATPPVVRRFDSTALAQHRAQPATSADSRALVGCGHALAAFDQQLAIVQPATARRCPPGEIGEVWVAGPSVAGGYWDREQETSRTFGAYLAESGTGPFLRTGDLGFVHDGELFITGRLKELIIIRGRNYYPQDIETTAEASHYALQPNSSAAFAIEREELPGEQLVIVHEMQRQHRSVSSDEVAAAVRQAVAAQHEVPVAAVVLIKPGSLPRTSSGKIQRHVCRDQFLAGSLAVLGQSTLDQPDAETSLPDPVALPSPAALRTLDPIEAARLIEAYLIVQIARLLGVAADRIDRALAPGGLGMDSLTAVELQHAVETDLGVELALSDVLQTASISELADALARQLRTAPADQPDRATLESAPPASYPLSYGQRALWFVHELAPDSAAYTIARAVRIAAPTLDVAALRAAFQTLADRHAALRTTVTRTQAGPVQQVQAAIAVAFAEIDSATWSDAALDARLRETARQPFDLVAGPLFRVHLFRRAPGQSILLLTVQHLVADGWSLTLLLRELEQLYSAAVAGQPLAAVRPSAQYADYVRWQAELLVSARGAELWRYWQQQLGADGDLPVLDLPLDHPRPAVQTYNGATHSFSLSGELVRQLRALGADHGATLYMTLLAAFEVLLQRYSGQPEIVVGSPVAGRSRARFADTIGYFVNLVVLRASLTPDLSFSAVLGQVRQTVLDALAHQDYPFPLLVERLQPGRDPSRSPLFQVLFALEKSPWSAPGSAAGPLDLAPVELEQGSAQFDLALMLSEEGAELRGALHYNTDLFEAATVARLAGHYQTLLHAIVDSPAERIGRLPLLTTAEQQQLRDWNASTANYPRAAVFHELFAAQAARTPDAVALIFEGQQLTYGQLNARANQLARYLQRRGVGVDTLVALGVSRSIEMIIGMVAIHKAGGAYVPLDPAYPAERLQFMLADTATSVLLTEAALVADIPAHQSEVVCLDRDWPAIAREDAADLPSTSGPQHRAYVIYTSGSTGRPKGVMVTQGGLLNLCFGLRAFFDDPAVQQTGLITSISFDISVNQIFPTLLWGRTLHVIADAVKYDSAALFRYLAAHQLHLLDAVPSYLLLMLQGSTAPLPNALRYLLIGGEKLEPRLLEAVFGRLGAALAIVNIYGLTEITDINALGVLRAADLDQPVTVGRPLQNNRIYIVGPHDTLQPVGVAGEVCVAGESVARGYLNRPGLTAEKFVVCPFEPGAIMCRTGDIGRWRADGTIEILGRRDHQVKLRGFRIEIGEIEALLAAQPGVREAVVVAREDVPGDQRLVAYVVGAISDQPSAIRDDGPENERRTEEQQRTGAPLAWANEQQNQGADHLPLTPGALRAALQERLPSYMVPSAVVLLSALPRTPNGKLDRKALPAPAADRARQDQPAVAPRSHLERTVTEIWQEVLQIEQIGPHDTFFDLGGHSLLVAQVQARLRERLNIELPLIDLFRYPTVSALATHLAGQGAVAEPSPPRAPDRRAASSQPAEIAIVGMEGRFPGAADVDQFWRNIQGGVEAITFFTDDELLAAGVDPATLRDPSYVKARGILQDIELFDADFFGISPREAAIMDPQHRLFLECAWNALERAGYDSLRYDGRIGVFAGVGLNTYLLAAGRAAIEAAGRYQALIGNDKDFVPTRVSYKLNLRGPSVNVQTACSSSLVAVHLACQSLLSGESDMVLAGGVTIEVPHKAGYRYEEGGIPSPDGHCRAFDARAGGMVFGSGVGVVVLKRLEDALADGDTIHAVIKGSAINNDGAQKIGYTAPSVDGQAAVIAAALSAAQVDPATIGYIEAHGTATPLGDPIEVAALNEVFRPHIAQTGVCALGSVKTGIGHLDTAAGVAGLIKAALALRHQQLPPSLHYEQPNPRIDFASGPFYVNTTLRDWTTGDTQRRAGVSSFGIGGTNAHVVLEEAPAPTPSTPAQPWQVLTLSARSAAALDRASANLQAYLSAHPAANLADVAYTLQIGRRAFDHRRVLVSRDTADAIGTLQTLDPEQVRSAHSQATEPPVVFMFPGQGTQHVGMARALYDSEPVFRTHIDRCCALLQPALGCDLRAVLYPTGDAAAATQQLTTTRLAQPALFVVEYALAQLWISWGIRPAAMIGHSIGEYVAATLAGVLTLEAALRLVALRGELMDALPGGAMLAVPLPEAELRPQLGSALSLAAINGPRLCVVAGPSAAVAAFEAQLGQQGIDTRRLHTSHAFHSAMMDPLLARFTAEVAAMTLRAPETPYISNLTGTWISAAEATDPHYWARHLRETVRFGDGLATLLAQPERVLLEVGPARTLSSLARQHPARDSQQVILASLRRPTQDADDRALILRALGDCWLHGLAVNWAALHAEPRHRIDLPTYPFERQRYWIDAAAPTTSSVRPAAGSADPADWFAIPFWKPALPPGPARTEHADQPGRWLVFHDGSPLGDRLIAGLRQRDQDVLTVTIGAQFDQPGPRAYTLDPARRADYERLIEALHGQGLLPERIVHLWSISGSPAQNQPATAQALVSSTSLLLLAQALHRAAHSAPVHLTVISDQTQSVHGAEPLCPAKATILGACQIIRRLSSRINCQHIDLIVPGDDRQQTLLARRLLANLSAAPASGTIAYRGHQRWTQQFEPVRLPDAHGCPDRLRDRGVYLIADGLSTAGLLLATALARSARARLALTGTIVLPERAVWADWLRLHAAADAISQQIRQIQALEALGAEVLVLRAAAADQTTMRAVIDRTTQHFGALHGVCAIAAAPGVRSGTFELDGLEARLLQPAVESTARLAELLQAHTLDFVLMVSSNGALTGEAGSVSAVFARRVIDALAEQQSRSGDTPWISLSLDLEHITDQGAPDHGPDPLALQSEQVIEMFQRVLATEAASQLIVSAEPIQRRLEQTLAPPAAPVTAPTRAARARPYAAPQTSVEQTLASIWQALLGVEQIGIHDNFLELGGHSLLATQVASQIQQQLQIKLPLEQLFEFPTIAQLATAIEQHTPGDTPVQAPVVAASREGYRVKRSALVPQRPPSQQHDQQQ